MFDMKKRLLAMALAVCMTVSMAAPALAADTDEPAVPPTSTEEPAATPTPSEEPEVDPVPDETPDVDTEPTETPDVQPEPTETPDVQPEPTETPDVDPEPTETPDVDPMPTESPAVDPMPTESPEVPPVPTETPAPDYEAMSLEELYALYQTMPEEEWILVLAGLSGEKYEALMAYIDEMEHPFVVEEAYRIYMAFAEEADRAAYLDGLTEKQYAELRTYLEWVCEAYDAYLAQPEADREAYLEGLSVTDPELYAALLVYIDAMKGPAVFDVETVYEYVTSLSSDAEIEEYLLSLTEEQYEALMAYALEKAMEEYEPPETVVVTDPGPLMPPVTVEGSGGMNFPSRAPARPGIMDPLGSSENNGLELSKKAEKTGEDAYTITLEAYTTGTVRTETSTKPIDVVLVLDQSGSMNDGFGGTSRQEAMKQSVKAFIDSVAGQYDAEKSDHRMAIVEFADGASVKQGWTFVDATGAGKLKTAVGGSENGPNGATNMGAGMEEAEYLMGDEGYDYTGKNTERHKVVIVFTDGVPTKNSNFDTGVANTAIGSAKRLKDGGTTIYTIGIFNGADPSQLYGDRWDYLVWPDITCNGQIGSYWGGSWFAEAFNGNDFPVVDAIAGNRFLNYLSSNYGDATEVGIERGTYDPGNRWSWGTGYKITQNFDPTTTDDYYLTASDSSSLNEIFEKISNSIGSPTMKLDSTTVIKDIVADHFVAPANTTDVKLYTATCNGKSGTEFTFKDPVEWTGGTVTIGNDNTVEVTGFDFNKNYVAIDEVTGKARGSKLIIEFTVKPEEGFWGGDDVPTNGPDSGVYTEDGSNVENFEVPTVDVPLELPELTGQTVHIYGGNAVPDWKDLVQLASGASFEGADEVQLTWTASKDGIPANISNLENGTYTVTMTATSGSQTASKTAEVTVVVHMPTITFQDSVVERGTRTPDYDTTNFVSTTWQTEGVVMTGDAPELVLTYDPVEDSFQTDTPVNVTVRNGGTDITAYVTFVRQACEQEGCENSAESSHPGSVSEPEFVVHVFIPEFVLTLVKELSGAAQGDQNFIFTISGGDVDMQVVLTVADGGSRAEESITLPSGTYTVTEESDWSWQWALSSVQASGDATSNGSSASVTGESTVTFTNAPSGTHWLGGSDIRHNEFSAKGQIQTSALDDALVPPTHVTSEEDDEESGKEEPDEPDMTGNDTQEGGGETNE